MTSWDDDPNDRRQAATKRPSPQKKHRLKIRTRQRPQLYDLDVDLGETNNLYQTKPEIADELLKQLISEIEAGRSTPVAPAKNDSHKIKVWKNR